MKRRHSPGPRNNEDEGTKGPRVFRKAQLPSRELKRYAYRPKATNPIRKTKEYKAFHKVMIEAHPVCANKSCDEPSTDIHHKVRITVDPDLVLDPKNVICTCEKCHHQIESAVNRGVDPAIWKHLFVGL